MGKNRSRQVTTQTKGRTTISQEFMSGPLPHPEHLDKYEQILHGAAERIISMAERQSNHRQKIEKDVIKSDIRNSTLGLIFGFIIGIVGMLSGFYLIYSGKVLEGSIYGGGTLFSLVGTFIYGTQQRRKERQSKQ